MAAKNIELAAIDDSRAVRTTLGFLLGIAVGELFPERDFCIDHSFIGGYFCHFGDAATISTSDLEQLKVRMDELLAAPTKIELQQVKWVDFAEYLRRTDQTEKMDLIDRAGLDPIPAIRFGEHLDYQFEPMTSAKGLLEGFALLAYDFGFLLNFPLGQAASPATLADSPKLYDIIHQSQLWSRALGVSSLPQLNRRIRAGGSQQLVMVGEALHEKTIADIANSLCSNFPAQRAIFIAGPSSSGKTSFAKRLEVQLQVNLHSTRSISMDDYFCDRDAMQRGPDGVVDWEALTTLNLDELVADIKTLLAGGTIQAREFDFLTGYGVRSTNTLHLPEDAFLIIEGLHGLNPIFAEKLQASRIQRIYVSAITQLNIDATHRISSSDNRLLRRLVRDSKYRGHTAEETIQRWPAVRQGEDKNIFPFQELADHMFNSSLVYELAVLSQLATSLLRRVHHESTAHPTAQRLLNFLVLAEPIADDAIPGNSILREFLGGSVYKY